MFLVDVSAALYEEGTCADAKVNSHPQGRTQRCNHLPSPLARARLLSLDLRTLALGRPRSYDRRCVRDKRNQLPSP